MSKYIIDLQAKRIDFADTRFYFAEDGAFVPSVTTIISEGMPKDPHFLSWLKAQGENADQIRDEAGRRGSIVHELTERYDLGEEINLMTENGNFQFKLSEWAAFERYTQFIGRYNPEMVMVEQNFVSAELGFAGTVDRVMTLNGEEILVDIKTSQSVHDSHWLQVAAYAELAYKCAGVNVDKVGILHLSAKTRTEGKNGAIQGVGWQLLTKTAEEAHEDFKIFRHVQQVWLATHKNDLPRKVSYQLSYKK